MGLDDADIVDGITQIGEEEGAFKVRLGAVLFGAIGLAFLARGMVVPLEAVFSGTVTDQIRADFWPTGLAMLEAGIPLLWGAIQLKLIDLRHAELNKLLPNVLRRERLDQWSQILKLIPGSGRKQP